MSGLAFYFSLVMSLAWWVQNDHFIHLNPLIIKQNTGEALEEWLKKFNWGHKGELLEQRALPQYKFYSEVVETLLNLARRMGGNYQEALLFLRQGLQSDRQFEKKMKEMNLGCWLQMLFIMALTWVFILSSLSLVDVEVSYFKLGLIALWQLVGLSFLPLLLRHFRNRLFGDIGRLWKMLYVLNSLARVPLARTEIFNMAKIHELKNIRQKSLMHIVEKLKAAVLSAMKQGGNYEEEVRYLMEELRFQEKWHFELFEKRLLVVKLGLLSLFFLPSYLAFIFLLLGDLMDLM